MEPESTTPEADAITTNTSDGQVVRAYASGGVDSGFIQRVQTNGVKLVFTAFLFVAEH